MDVAGTGAARVMKLLRIVGLALVSLGSGAFVWLFYVQLHYYAVMPRTPDPSSGRMYPYTANRSHVYVTRKEVDRGRLAEIVGPFGILGAMVGALLIHRAAKRQDRSSKDHT